MVKLSGGDARGLLDLISVGKTLSCQRIAAEEPPPTFLQVQPASSCGDKDMMEPGMFSHPGTSLSTVMTAEIICDKKDVTPRVVSFDVLQERDVVGGVARSGTPGHLFAITHTQRSIHPGFLRPAAVIERRFDAVPCDRPAGRWRERAGHYRPELVSADGRRPLGRLGVVGDDRGSFGTKSGSSLVPQLCV